MVESSGDESECTFLIETSTVGVSLVILSRYGFLREIRVRIKRKVVEGVSKSQTSNSKRKSEGLRKPIRRSGGGPKVVKLQCTWLEPGPSGLGAPSVVGRFRVYEDDFWDVTGESDGELGLKSLLG